MLPAAQPGSPSAPLCAPSCQWLQTRGWHSREAGGAPRQWSRPRRRPRWRLPTPPLPQCPPALPARRRPARRPPGAGRKSSGPLHTGTRRGAARQAAGVSGGGSGAHGRRVATAEWLAGSAISNCWASARVLRSWGRQRQGAAGPTGGQEGCCFVGDSRGGGELRPPNGTDALPESHGLAGQAGPLRAQEAGATRHGCHVVRGARLQTRVKQAMVEQCTMATSGIDGRPARLDVGVSLPLTVPSADSAVRCPVGRESGCSISMPVLQQDLINHIPSVGCSN